MVKRGGGRTFEGGVLAGHYGTSDKFISYPVHVVLQRCAIGITTYNLEDPQKAHMQHVAVHSMKATKFSFDWPRVNSSATNLCSFEEHYVK